MHQITNHGSLLNTLDPDRIVKPKGVYLMKAENLPVVYGEDARNVINELLEIDPVPISSTTLLENKEALAEAEFAVAGWGTPLMNEAFLEMTPNLKAVFYAGGSIRSIVTPAFWDRNIIISSAYGVNAIPVAEFTLAAILLSLKHFWRLAREAKAGAPWGDHRRIMPGGYNSVVGLVSAGRIARQVLQLLKSYDIKIVINCPFLSQNEARQLETELKTIEQLFAESDVVSIHTPLLDSTTGMIGARLISSMKPGATLINTARGGVINESELISVLRKRPDLTAVLDVTAEEPPQKDSPLLELPNVVITPHIAGSQGPECRRLGQTMVDELMRYLNHEPLLWQITRESSLTLA